MKKILLLFAIIILSSNVGFATSIGVSFANTLEFKPNSIIKIDNIFS